MHRVFCAAAGDLEIERRAFHDLIGDFNETQAAGRGVLFVPVALTPHMADKRFYQPAIDENIRACRYYVQVMENSWGPPEKNCERDYALAMECRDNPALPMEAVVVLFKRTGGSPPPELGNLAPHYDFSTIEEYRQVWWSLLAAWLETAAATEPVRRRPVAPDDEEFLHNLIVATVAEELQAWAWPEGMRAQLLDMQYRVRRNGVEQNYPAAERSIILAGDLPVGWMVVQKSAAEIHVVDIAILPERRGSGIGTAVMRELLAESDRNGIPVRLSVNVTNRAAKLYERLEFRRTGGNEVQHFMERKPAGAA